MKKKRLIGILLISICGILLKCARIISILTKYETISNVALVYSIAWDIFVIVLFVGLFNLKDWARMLLLVITGVSWLANVVGLVGLSIAKFLDLSSQITAFAILTRLLFIAIASFVFYYLTLSKVKAQFEPSPRISRLISPFQPQRKGAV